MIDLAALNVPGPIYEPLNAPFWQAAEQGRLVIQRCGSCGEYVFYPRPICPHCWADALEWGDVTGQATLKSFSIIHKPGHPGWREAAPYPVGLVTLKEGPTLLSHIVTNHLELSIGAALRFTPQNIAGRVLPCFQTTSPS